MDGLYSLRRAKFKDIPEVDPMAGPTFPNVPPPAQEETWEEVAARRASLEGVPSATFGSQGEQLATALAGAKPTPEGTAAPENPYAFWKTPVGANKEGKGGIPLDLAVTLAGVLASSIAPKEWGGRTGAGLAQMAQAGGQAHADWVKGQGQEKLEREKIGLEKERLAIEKSRKTETQVLSQGGEEAQTYIENQIKLKQGEVQASETDLDKAVKTNQLESLSAQRKLFEFQRSSEERKLDVELSPEQIKTDRERTAAETEYYRSKATEADAAGKYHLSLIGKEGKTVDKEGLEMFKQSALLYKQGQSAFIGVITGMKVGEKTAAIDQLTAITSAHIYATQSSLGRTAPANDAMSFWLESVAPEVAVDVPKKGWIFTGSGPEVELKLQKYAKNARSLVEAMGAGIDPGVEKKALNLITEVCAKTTLTKTSADLAQWAIKQWGIPQYLSNPEFRQDIEKLKALIQPATTGSPVEKDLTPLEVSH